MSESSPFRTVIHEVADRVATVTLHRPDRLDAIGAGMPDDGDPIAEGVRR